MRVFEISILGKFDYRSADIYFASHHFCKKQRVAMACCLLDVKWEGLSWILKSTQHLYRVWRGNKQLLHGIFSPKKRLRDRVKGLSDEMFTSTRAAFSQTFIPSYRKYTYVRSNYINLITAKHPILVYLFSYAKLVK